MRKIQAQALRALVGAAHKNVLWATQKPAYKFADCSSFHEPIGAAHRESVRRSYQCIIKGRAEFHAPILFLQKDPDFLRGLNRNRNILNTRCWLNYVQKEYPGPRSQTNTYPLIPLPIPLLSHRTLPLRQQPYKDPTTFSLWVLALKI